MVAEHKAQLRSVCFKTKMCKFFILGQCNRDECDYAHSPDELKSAPDLRRTKVCPTLVATGVCTARHCAFAHDRTELRTVRLAEHKQGAQPSSQVGQGGSPRSRALTGEVDVRSQVGDGGSRALTGEADVRRKVDAQQQLRRTPLGSNQRVDLASMQMNADHASMEADVRSQVDTQQQLLSALLGSNQRADLPSMQKNADDASEPARREAYPVNFASQPFPMDFPMKVCPKKLHPEPHFSAGTDIRPSSLVGYNEGEGAVFGQNAGQVATGIGSHLLAPSPPTTFPFAQAGLTDTTMALNMAMALLQGISVVDGGSPSHGPQGLQPLKVAMTMA